MRQRKKRKLCLPVDRLRAGFPPGDGDLVDAKGGGDCVLRAAFAAFGAIFGGGHKKAVVTAQLKSSSIFGIFSVLAENLKIRFRSFAAV